MKLSYKQRIFCYFLFIFALFAVSIIIFEQKEEKKQRTEALENKLDNYAEIIHAYIERKQISDSSMNMLSEIADIFHDSIRITIINIDGKVIFDKDVDNISSLDNHLDRPEIRKALFQSYGSNIRMSASTNHEYLYYAKHYPTYFVRVALPYNIETKGMLKADNLFIYIVLVLFVFVLILLNYAAGRFGKSISQLKNLTTSIKENKPLPVNTEFQNDEVGEIGKELVDILRQKEQSKREIEIEREKLIKHFQFSEKGICIFTHNFKKIYNNTHFVQFLNIITDHPIFDPELIVKEEIFDPAINFIYNKNRQENDHTFQITKNGKVFIIQTIVFEDDSFEITIRDITKIEKNRLLKQEMTNNIAHELRTPVTSLRGYLETLNDQQLPVEKQKQFISRAYDQIIRLSNLIEDVSLLSKIEETGAKFELEKVNVLQLINEVRIDLADRLKENHIHLNISVKDNVFVNGNYTLLYSIFRNLMDNSINYGGQDIDIYINNYLENDDYLYFSFYDTGIGVDEQHLNRLFERFYRVNEGRTRDTGGSGLGLSIVKNAVQFHKGEIQVKNRINAGLEFLFTLKK